MPGDYSRRTFDSSRHYSGVLKQQGRVDLDADHNELVEILQHRTNEETIDVIGGCGVPITSTGFKIGIATGGNDFTISAGRMYVGGLMCELEASGTTYTTQPYYPKPASTTQVSSSASDTPASSLRLALTNNKSYLAFIDAWQREITALDDPRIREVALGGPDTTARLQTVWQVRLLLLTPSSTAELSCQTALHKFDQLTEPKTGKMNARAKPAQNQKDPCLLPPTAGFKGLENQLYRVQVHTGGDFNTATFKWSRNNATFESTIKDISGSIITVDEIAKDEFLRFAGGQWVEIVDPESELNSSPRALVQIDSVDPSTGEITMKTSVAAFGGLKNAKLRAWDQIGPSSNSSGVRMNLAQWIDLESGVQVSFSSGTYQAGDYWLIPARTATGEIEWPFAVAQPPVGVQHHYCKLALISVAAAGATIVADCRPLFPPLTKLTQLHYVSGDGQEGSPGGKLGAPLQVGVANGSFPVEDARVRFDITDDGTGNLTGRVATVTTIKRNIVVRTGADGVAECEWQLDGKTKLQRVQATLVDHKSLPVRFNATFQQAETQPGIHIKAVNLRSPQPLNQLRDLRNDMNVSPEELADGISITCDENINEVSIKRPTCFVTVEMPFPFNNADREIWSRRLIGFQPLILSAEVSVAGNTITWTPSKEAIAFLRNLFEVMGERELLDPVLTHLTLKGNFIWAAGNPNLYLDGEAFGTQRPILDQADALPTERLSGDTSINGTQLSPNIDIRLQSGDGWKGGDFEMWFWLKSTLSPKINVTPPQLDFRQVQVPAGTAGALPTGMVTVSNEGTAPLAVSSMNIKPNNNESFEFADTPAPAPFTLEHKDDQQQVHVRFLATSITEPTGTLKVNSNDPVTPTVSVDLVGPGLPKIVVKPNTLDFNTATFVPGAPLILTLTVRNKGGAQLNVTDIHSSNSAFVVTPTFFSVRADEAKTDVSVQFSSDAATQQVGKLTIASNDLASSPTVDLIGPVPKIDVTPPELVFGKVRSQDNFVGVTRDVTVRNTGKAILKVENINSDNPAVFTVDSPTTPFFVAADPAAKQIVTVRFHPTVAGQQSGVLTITSNDPAKLRVDVPMSGNFVPDRTPPAKMEVDATPLNFGEVFQSGANQPLIVKNTGGLQLDVDPIASSNPALFSVLPKAAFSVQPGGQKEVTVQFTPGGLPNTKKQSEQLTITSKDQPTIVIKVTGKLKL